MADRGEATGRVGESREAGDQGAGDKMKEKAREAQERASEVTSKAKEKGSELLHEGREKAEELAHRAEDRARGRASVEKTRVAEGIRTVADSLRQGSRDLPEDQQAYGRFVEAVAERADGLSRYLEEHDVDEMAREAKRFARENTGVMLTGAFALGLLGARFLKSSSDEVRTDRWTSRGYEGRGTYEAGYRTSGGYPEGRMDEAPGAYSQGEIRRTSGAASSEYAELDELDGLEDEGPGVGRDPSGLNLDRSDDSLGDRTDTLDRGGL